MDCVNKNIMDIMQSRKEILEKYKIVLDRIRSVHIKSFPGYPGPLFLISNTYPGVWLEHVYDAISWANFDPSMSHVARAQTELFLNNQREDGQLPCFVLDKSNPNVVNFGQSVGYGQIQECVSFTSLCLETYKLINDKSFLKKAYERCVNWDNWLCSNRMTLKKGLIELFCEHDTGHDNSARLADVVKGCPNADAKICCSGDFMPLLAPDMNSVFYGSRMALAEMADILNNSDDAEHWKQKALEVKKKLFELCYDAEDEFFYDVDLYGTFRKFRSIHIANLFQEHLIDGNLAEKIYTRYLRNPNEFWTQYPFPSMSISDPSSKQDRDGNSWGFYSQGLTALRTMRWMDYYGKGKDLEYIMGKWIVSFVNSRNIYFSQELHPITGELSKSSEWYSSSMLFFIHSVRRLGFDK